MQNKQYETQGEDVFVLKRELAALVMQSRMLKEKRDKLAGKKTKRRPAKPLGPNSELWPEQVMMILGVNRRRLTSMLKTGQLADLHPYSVGSLTAVADTRLNKVWKKKYDYWKLQWADYNAWKKEAREKRAENAMKLAQMLMGADT